MQCYHLLCYLGLWPIHTFKVWAPESWSSSAAEYVSTLTNSLELKSRRAAEGEELAFTPQQLKRLEDASMRTINNIITSWWRHELRVSDVDSLKKSLLLFLVLHRKFEWWEGGCEGWWESVAGLSRCDKSESFHGGVFFDLKMMLNWAWPSLPFAILPKPPQERNTLRPLDFSLCLHWLLPLYLCPLWDVTMKRLKVRHCPTKLDDLEKRFETLCVLL